MKIKIAALTFMYLLLRGGCGYCQTELPKDSLPRYIEHDTVILRDVWVQSVREEAEQRQKILSLQTKLEKVSITLQNKKKVNSEILKNIEDLKRLQQENDSLRAYADSIIYSDCTNQIKRNGALLAVISEQQRQISKLKRIKKRLTFSTIPVVLGVVLLVIVAL